MPPAGREKQTQDTSYLRPELRLWGNFSPLGRYPGGLPRVSISCRPVPPLQGPWRATRSLSSAQLGQPGGAPPAWAISSVVLMKGQAKVSGTALTRPEGVCTWEAHEDGCALKGTC